MSRVWRPALAAAIAIPLALCRAQTSPISDSVEFWDDRDPPEGALVAVHARGADATTPGGSPFRIHLAEIRTITGPLAPDFARHKARARLAWRAESRMARGDWINALPIYEALNASATPEDPRLHAGEMAARFRAQDPVAALLAWVRSRPSTDRWPRWMGVHHESRLPIVFPPPIDGGADARALAEASASIESHRRAASDEAAWFLGVCLLAAEFSTTPDPDRDRARRRLDALESTLDPASLDTPWVRTVRQGMLALIGEPTTRDEARAAMRRRLAGEFRDDPMLAVWTTFFLGVSLVSEQDGDQIELGITVLLRLAAADDPMAEALTVRAMRRAERAAETLHDRDSAAKIRRDRTERFPAYDRAP